MKLSTPKYRYLTKMLEIKKKKVCLPKKSRLKISTYPVTTTFFKNNHCLAQAVCEPGFLNNNFNLKTNK